MNSCEGNRSARLVSVVDVDTGEELLPADPTTVSISQEPGGANAIGRSDWDAGVLIASWVALYPEMADSIRTWIEDARAMGLTLQLAEILIRRRAEVEELRIISEREKRTEQIDDSEARAGIEPLNPFEAQLIDLKDGSDALRAQASEMRRAGGDMSSVPCGGRGESMAPRPPPLDARAERTAKRGPLKPPGMSRLPPHLQPAMDIAKAEYAAAVAERERAEARYRHAKAAAEEADAQKAVVRLAGDDGLKKKALDRQAGGSSRKSAGSSKGPNGS
ncbi:MAG: hypothetical protein LBF26_01060 [Puniceicoccales bacterium]|jgi:hypothetical protein|nr:hypothetical protein [Puniceicoccales bacterium]